MSKVKLFYSYSHEDEEYRDELKKHLATLQSRGLIDEWHDRRIDAGDDWDDEIEKNIATAHVILLLFSATFIASKACQKEVKRAMELRKEKGTIVIPIILKACSWKDVNGISKIQALPQSGRAVQKWTHEDEAWSNVYDGIKERINTIREEFSPNVRAEFVNELLSNPLDNCTLDTLFVYPDILETNKSFKQKLEKNEIDSVKLKNLNEFKNRSILIEGEEQSGKSSLCSMLYYHYVNNGLYPILINGSNISGKANLVNLVNNAFTNQYESIVDYWSIDKGKRIFLIDDVDEWKANKTNTTDFISSIGRLFENTIVFIDKLSSLSEKRTEHHYFSGFATYSIRHFGHAKRDEIIKKCISYDENIEFDEHNNEQLGRLDRDTKHINTIIGSNIVPSYPLFIIIIFHAVESAGSQDLSQTSYGHCYQAMITMNLGRSGIKSVDIHVYFNFLAELAYFMFKKGSEKLDESKMMNFTVLYEKKYFFIKGTIAMLLRANILTKKNNNYHFTYIYIYYYFVAKRLSTESGGETESIIKELMSNLHAKDSANIIIFITHHSNNKDLLDDIILGAMSTFEDFPEAILSGDEKTFIKRLSDSLEEKKMPGPKHCVQTERKRELKRKDELDIINEQSKIDNDEGDDSSLLIEIRKSAKSMEIIGQILKNQYGSLERDKQKEMFEEGQNVGLRLLKSFMEFMTSNGDEITLLINTKLELIAKEKGKDLTEEERDKISQKIISQVSYSIIFSWLHKIVDSLGYDKLIGVADEVNAKIDTVASKLINLYINTWHAKKLDVAKIKSLYVEFENDKNHQAIYILKDIVSRYVYMHHIDDYRDKHKIASLLGFSLKNQISVQQKIT